MLGSFEIVQIHGAVCDIRHYGTNLGFTLDALFTAQRRFIALLLFLRWWPTCGVVGRGFIVPQVSVAVCDELRHGGVCMLLLLDNAGSQGFRPSRHRHETAPKSYKVAFGNVIKT